MVPIDELGLTNLKRIQFGLIDNEGYLSLDIGWIRFQFKTVGSSQVQCRVLYGNSTTGWQSIQNRIFTSSITQTWGTLVLQRVDRIIIYQWRGNATAPPSTTSVIGTVSDVYKPNQEYVQALKGTGNRGYLVIGSNGSASITMPDGVTTWTNANITAISANVV